MFIATAIKANENGETVWTGVREVPAAINASKEGGRGRIENGRLITEKSIRVNDGDVIAIYVQRRHSSVSAAYEADGHDEGGISAWEYFIAIEDGDLSEGVAVKNCIVAPSPGPCNGYYVAIHDGDTVTLARN